MRILKKVLNRLYHSYRKGSVRCLLHWLCNGHLVKIIKISLYLRNNKYPKLQIAGGIHTINGWINGDIVAGDIYLNAARKLPFSENSVDYIFSEQFLEHLDFNRGRYFLKECNRILKPGGVIRVSTPDLHLLIKTYYDKNPLVTLYEAMERHRRNHNLQLLTGCEFLNDFFRLWGHKFIYNKETLKNNLEEAGFVNISRCRFGESKNRELTDKERHADVEWMKYAWILISEGTKD